MSYEVKGHILGFDKTRYVDIVKIDELFATMQDRENEAISFTLINPYPLREYSFEVPAAIQALLELKEDSNLFVYNIVVIQKPLEESRINFLAPIIINEDNKTVAQVVLDPRNYPDFGIATPIKEFIKE
ncbi:Flagellar assembly factor FliW [hydrothermal vent metagenome]|uniref:Flagellar assembly factor FliW n=1 Tax=hydrothermal vent metagenome TaxID=652676 RepID=A0A1W1BC38_9ZZZZ